MVRNYINPKSPPVHLSSSSSSSSSTYEMMTEVCREVEQEPVLLPLSGEQLWYQTSNKRENARLDISARGFWIPGERAFFDIKVFDPTTPATATRPYKKHMRQENEKKKRLWKTYHWYRTCFFTTLAFSITGGMSTVTLKVYNRLAEMLVDKRGQPR